MKLTTTTTRTLVLSLALVALGGTVVATADPRGAGGGTTTAQATSTTNRTGSSSQSSSNATSSSTSSSTSGGSSTCASTVVVTIDGRREERTERTSGSRCSTSVELRHARTIVSGSVAGDGALTATRARRLARAVLEGALGRPVRGRIRCTSPAPRHMTCTAAGPRGPLARLAIRRTGSGDAERWAWRGAIERP